MRDFRDYAMVYRRFEQFPAESRAGQFFYRLTALDTSTVYPLLLEVVKRHADRDDKEMGLIFGDIESFLVRRAVCGLTTKNYNEFFVRVSKACMDKDDFSHAHIRSLLLAGSSETARWPADDEFRERWCNVEMYRRLKRSTLMILEALEGTLRGSKTENQPLKLGVLTVEHLLPQKWESEWATPLPKYNESQEQADRRRKQALHRVGNLTLLTKALIRNPEKTRARTAHDRVARGVIVCHDVCGKEATHDDQGTFGGRCEGTASSGGW